MANLLNEKDASSYVGAQGQDVHVIDKQIPAKVGIGSDLFEILMWVLGIIPGIVLLIKKIQAGNYFRSLEQRIQHHASQIDNYLEQRVVILKNCAKLVEKSVDLDKSVFPEIALNRSGGNREQQRNELANQLDVARNQIQLAVESYPELQSHKAIADAMKENMYLQQEITAARELYNDAIASWNTSIFEWPAKMMVAAKNGYTSRIPFATTAAIKEQAREVLF